MRHATVVLNKKSCLNETVGGYRRYQKMWMGQTNYTFKPVTRSLWADIAIAIPARNEASSILRCLKALDRACFSTQHMRVTIFVLVNNSSDETARKARQFNPQFAEVVVEEITLHPHESHAGGARRRAMDEAATIAGPDGLLMTSDADSEVSPDWILANITELSKGADAVAGSVTFKPKDRAQLMPMLLARAAEWRLANLQARLATLIDPVAHDPWPTHLWEWGASLAVTAQAYQSIGGLPPIPLAEDRAFAKALSSHDFKVRHSHAPVVFTSGRLQGRAPQGFADLLHDYCNLPDTPCDAAIEPTVNLIHRLQARNSLRRLHGSSMGFGALWQKQETHDVRLQRYRVYPEDLAAEVVFAAETVNSLEKSAGHLPDTLRACFGSKSS